MHLQMIITGRELVKTQTVLQRPPFGLYILLAASMAVAQLAASAIWESHSQFLCLWQPTKEWQFQVMTFKLLNNLNFPPIQTRREDFPTITVPDLNQICQTTTGVLHSGRQRGRNSSPSKLILKILPLCADHIQNHLTKQCGYHNYDQNHSKNLIIYYAQFIIVYHKINYNQLQIDAIHTLYYKYAMIFHKCLKHAILYFEILLTFQLMHYTRIFVHTILHK